MIEGQGKGIEVMLLGARSRVTNSGGLRVLPAGAAGVVVRCEGSRRRDDGAAANGKWRRKEGGRRGKMGDGEYASV